MPNVSELTRLHEERDYLIKKIHSRISKHEKEARLRQLREVERTLGIEGQPYNSSAFGSDGDVHR